MKKTFPANINGSVFYIDEDAYNLLNTYLSQLRQAFPSEEGEEIVNDIEARISELFGEIIGGGANVITIGDVNSVIEQMGRPAELSEQPEGQEASVEEGSEETPAEAPKEDEATPPPFPGVSKKLYRNLQNKVFGGVLSGVALYFGWNANILRLLVAVLALCTYFWPLVVVYLIAWMVIPAAVTPRQILEMKGSPVTVDSVGRTIIGTADPYAPGGNEGGLLSALGKAILIFFGIIAGIIAIGITVFFIKVVCGLILYWSIGNPDILIAFDVSHTQGSAMGALGTIALALSVGIPCVAAVWGISSAVFKTRRISRRWLLIGAIVEVAMIIAATVLLTIAKSLF